MVSLSKFVNQTLFCVVFKPNDDRINEIKNTKSLDTSKQWTLKLFFFRNYKKRDDSFLIAFKTFDFVLRKATIYYMPLHNIIQQYTSSATLAFKSSNVY